MRRFVTVVVLICVASSFFGTSLAYANDGENKVVKFFKNLVNWPLNVTKKSSEAVGRTIDRPIRGTTTTVSSAVEAVTGKPEKIKDVITEPILATGETAITAVEGIVEAPIEGTAETFKETE